MQASKMLAVLAISAILVMGAWTFVVTTSIPSVSDYQQGQPTISNTVRTGTVSLYVAPKESKATGLVTVNVVNK
jgi:hypothetical protein